MLRTDNPNMLPTVRLKHQDKQRPTEANKVVELAYGKFNVPFTRIINTNEGFKVVCRNEQDADKILSKPAKVELQKIGLTVITPPETKARRSIIIKQLDQIIGSNSPEDIKLEIERENAWLKIEEVVKIKNYTHILKLRLEEISMVQKARQQGILAYNMSISPNQIEQETYIHITTCFKCYQMEEHLTKDCPYPELKICSECSEMGHTFRECRNNEKYCINCKKTGNQANHRTLAMSCPLRKKIIADKTKESRNTTTNKEDNTYAEIARRAVAEVRQSGPTTQINLSEYKHTKILISIMHAHVMNLCNPGTYKTELNEMLAENDLPTMWFPENPNSGKLLGAAMNGNMEMDETETSTLDDETQATHSSIKTPVRPSRDPRLQLRHQDNSTIQKNKPRSKSRDRRATVTAEETCYPENAQEIGLKIYVTGKTIVPTMDPHIEHVIEQIQSGSYKWTYINSQYDEDLVKQSLIWKKIKVTKNDFKKVDEGSFRKIRNGLNIRSPPQEQKKTKKHQ